MPILSATYTPTARYYNHNTKIHKKQLLLYLFLPKEALTKHYSK